MVHVVCPFVRLFSAAARARLEGMVASESGERWWEAELHRLKGDLEIADAHGQHDVAEACISAASEIAREQRARAFELRAALSLARLRRAQGRRTEARDLLAPVYGWFTEGFTTQDLKEAKALLDEVA